LTGVINDRLRSKEEKRKDILQFLINCSESEVDDDRLTSEAIMSETILFLIAGSETTSNSIGFAIIELLSNPEKLEKLRQEIDSIELEENQTIFRHEQLKHLPYLNAVINETLRIDAVAASGLERITDKPTILGQLVLPKGVSRILLFKHEMTKLYDRSKFSVTYTILRRLANIGPTHTSSSLKDGSKMKIVQMIWKPFSHLAQGKLF
jgi:cytochrome P450